VAVVAAWVIDSRAHRNAVLPNVRLVGKSVRGMTTSDLEETVRASAARFAAATVEVRSPGGTFRAGVPELGVAVNEERTVHEVLRAGRTGAAPRRLWTWARSFLFSVKVPTVVDVDRTKLDGIVVERDKGRTPPVEPGLAISDGHLDGVPGKNGRGVDPAELAGALRLAEPTEGTLVVTIGDSSLPPRFSKSDADQLAAEGEQLVNAGLKVAVDERVADIPATTLRSWLRAVPADAGLRLGLAPDADVIDGLAELLPDVGTRPVDAGFTVSGGAVSITPSRTGTACCAPEARGALEAAIFDPAARAAPIQVPLRTVNPDRDEEAARQLGIVQPVATFTTPHNAGEPRVANIHLMADTIRGTVIPPGATYSINGTVGRRTKEKGYVEAPIISNEYVFESDVGGGVSQFATTMFNAAFLAGLDIPDYAMHGLYISRYPYGREATLSFPSPDLKVHNSTPYGVLIWPTYTASSITVTLYSTSYVTGEQTGQTRQEREARPPPRSPPDTPSAGPCVDVTTERTRTYLDGRKEVDHFSALYAPAEGWSCP
jgi:vancomycin resistance protein YoaR